MSEFLSERTDAPSFGRGCLVGHDEEAEHFFAAGVPQAYIEARVLDVDIGPRSQDQLRWEWLRVELGADQVSRRALDGEVALLEQPDRMGGAGCGSLRRTRR